MYETSLSSSPPSLPRPPLVERPPLIERAALRTLQAGALAVVLVAAPYKLFDLDRFFVPKELALFITALVAGVLCLAYARRLTLNRADELLALFLGVGVLSALFATNWWLAGRAVAVSLAGAICFWAARSLARRGFGRPLVAALALAGVVGAATALLQAYGLRIEYMSLNRAPGGTFGNRNFMAHLCVICLPALLLTALRSPTRKSLLRWAGGVAIVAAALIFSRSRAAWLALIVSGVIMLPLIVIALRRGRDDIRVRRLVVLAVAAVLGAGVALALPNTLDWRSDSPYLDTAKSVVNYKEGSGHGRLVQYATTVRMSLRHPLFGVGPGNWAVDYPHFAHPGDPSLSSEGMTSNPWPSSDWMTFLSERGLPAFVLLALAMVALLADGLRALRDGRSAEERLVACTLIGTLAVLLVAASFDAVLLLPVAALIAWALLGALSPPSRERLVVQLPLPVRTLLLLCLTGALGAAAKHSVSQLRAMDAVSATTKISGLERASQLDPGSYRIRSRLAAAYFNRGNCAKTRLQALEAERLFPQAPAPKRMLARCGRVSARPPAP